MAAKTRPVIIQYPKQSETYEVPSAAVAKKVHPNAKIIGYAGSFEPYEEAVETPLTPPTPAPKKD